jgi:hypothetical protein
MISSGNQVIAQYSGYFAAASLGLMTRGLLFYILVLLM